LLNLYLKSPYLQRELINPYYACVLIYFTLSGSDYKTH
jgi:hypothetical protein